MDIWRTEGGLTNKDRIINAMQMYPVETILSRGFILDNKWITPKIENFLRVAGQLPFSYSVIIDLLRHNNQEKLTRLLHTVNIHYTRIEAKHSSNPTLKISNELWALIKSLIDVLHIDYCFNRGEAAEINPGAIFPILKQLNPNFLVSERYISDLVHRLFYTTTERVKIDNRNNKVIWITYLHKYLDSEGILKYHLDYYTDEAINELDQYILHLAT